ncbi:hypothetical protein Tco_1503968 [Tanacetum coccineum]
MEIKNQKAIEAQAKADAIEVERIKGRDSLYKVIGKEVVEGLFKKRIIWMVRLTDPPSAGSVPCYGGSMRGAGTTFVIL